MGKVCRPKKGALFAAFLALMPALFLFSGCAVQSSSGKPIVKECVRNADQTGTFEGRWKITPVKLALKANDFSEYEIEEIVAAVKVWNDFYKSSLGFQVIDAGDNGSVRTTTAAKSTSLCSTNIVSGNSFAGQVVVYKIGTWPAAYSKSAIALTSYCPTTAKPLNVINNAMMELNYQYFFREDTKQPDLRSIFIHEFGHLIGLDHSCDVKGKTGFPNCNNADLPPDYFYAVMFPVILFDDAGFGEKRHSLETNDQGRANCLYGDWESGTSTASE
jgi:hypothetical protein